MQRRTFLRTLACAAAALGAGAARADEGLVVIANEPLRGIDADLLKRIYTGRAIEANGQALRPVNLPSTAALRQRFLTSVLQQADADYVAYWTVRRYVGKGAPPPEVASAADVIAYVQRTPGGMGYIDAADLKPGLNVVWRR